MSVNEASVDSCFTFVWRIENFSFCTQGQGEELCSPKFIVDTPDNSSWNLGIYPRGFKDYDYLGFYLNRLDSNEEATTIVIDYELAILSADDGSPLSRKIVSKEFVPVLGFGFKKFVPLKDIYDGKYLFNDTLTARCFIWTKNKAEHEMGMWHDRTRIEVERGTFTWSIQDFSTLPSGERKSINLTTYSNRIPPTVLNLNAKESTNKKFRLEANQVNTKHNNVFAFNVSLKCSGGKTIEFAKGRHLFKITEKSKFGLFESFLTMDDIIANKDENLPKDVLTLQCDISMSSGLVVNDIENEGYSPLPYASINPAMIQLAPDFDSRQLTPDSHSAIKTDLQSLHSEEILCDVKVIAGGQTFPTHKSILSARSPIFRAMFTTEMKEKTSDSVDIPDFGAQTVQQMLRYFYSDTVEDLQWDAMTQLYEIADKYQVLSLKQKCSAFLKKRINTSNACNLLLLSHLHLDDDMKNRILNFFSHNDSEIMLKDNWKMVEKDYPQLAIETLKCVHFKIK